MLNHQVQHLPHVVFVEDHVMSYKCSSSCRIYSIEPR